MKTAPVKNSKLIVLLFAVIFQFSCTKDSDLMADYLISDAQGPLSATNTAVDDYFVVDKGNKIILDVLSNDNYKDPSKVTIVNVSQPENGTVIINEDQTLTYIPEQADGPTENTDSPKTETPQENNDPDESDSPEESAGSDESADTDESTEETGTEEPTETSEQTKAPEESQTPEVSETPDETTAPEEASPKEDQSPAEEEESTTDSFTYETKNEDEDETTEATVTVTTENEDETTEATEPTDDEKTDTKPDDNFLNVDYYVTTKGSSNNDGRTEASAWSIEQAFKNAKAGDVVAIKAGNYGNKQLTQENSGTNDNPIRFIGYTDTPGDVVSSNGSTFKYGDQLDANKMPLLEDKSTNGEVTGTALQINGQYVQIMNFQISKYSRGLVSSGANNTIVNIVSINAGNHNPSKNRPNASSDKYSGVGINVRGDNSIIKNCNVINSGAEAFTISGDNIIHDYNTAYCDTDINPTDYYYLLANANNNTVNNIYVERVGNLYHKGHGIILKVSAKNNVIQNSTVINTAFELSFSGVENNTIENCFIGNYDSNQGRGKIGSILIANGAHNNTFKNCVVDKSSESGVKFMDWVDGSNNPNDAANAGNNNLFENCTISNVKYAIDFNSDWNHPSTPAHDNIFEECTIKDSQYLFKYDRVNMDNKIVNSIIENVANYSITKKDGKYKLEASIDSATELINCGFSKP